MLLCQYWTWCSNKKHEEGGYDHRVGRFLKSDVTIPILNLM